VVVTAGRRPSVIVVVLEKKPGQVFPSMVLKSAKNGIRNNAAMARWWVFVSLFAAP